jgi:hypothetical protein
MKRLLMAGIVVLASLSLAAPVAAADTFHYRNSGSGVFAAFSQFPEEWPPAAGTYFVTDVNASEDVEAGGETFGPGVCVFHDAIVVDDDGNIIDETSFGACAEGADLQIDRRLEHATLSASLEVTECLAYDEETWECIEEISLGQLDVDLEFEGVGPIERSHSTGSFGSAGLYQLTGHRGSSDRAALVSGTVELDGQSLIDGATEQDAAMFSSRGGEVEVIIDPSFWE